jgi:diphthamide biosynthesis methyltransferase
MLLPRLVFFSMDIWLVVLECVRKAHSFSVVGESLLATSHIAQRHRPMMSAAAHVVVLLAASFMCVVAAIPQLYTSCKIAVAQ